MIRFLIDTDTAIEVQRRRSRTVSAAFAQHAGELAVSTVTAFELWFGAERSSDPAQNRSATNEFLSLFSIVEFDLEAASHAAEIRAELAGAGTPIGPYDLQIAAIARARGLIVVSGNTREFGRVPGLRTVDWLRG